MLRHSLEGNSCVDIDTLYWGAIDVLSEMDSSIILSLVQTMALVEDNDQSTAYITRRNGAIVIGYNIDFVSKYASTPQEFAGIIFHEILHSVLGHLTMPIGKEKEPWAIALDAIVQSTIRASITPSTANVIMPFINFYELDGPQALLRPPHPKAHKVKSEKIKQEDIAKFRGKIYPTGKRLPSGFLPTSSSLVTEEDVYQFLLSNYCEVGSIKLVGSIKSDKVFTDKEIEDIAKDLDKLAGSGGALSNFIIKTSKASREQLRRAAWLATLDSTKASIVSSFSDRKKPARSVVLPSTLASSDLLKMAGGCYPVFFKSGVSQPKRKKCIVYIDVSGSVMSMIGWIYSCIQDISRTCEVEPVLFSTICKSTTMEDIAKGFVTSTGGTSFECIIQDALGRTDSKFLIFTDGYADATQESVVKAKKLNFVGAIIEPGVEAYLQKFCSKIVKVPGPDRS